MKRFNTFTVAVASLVFAITVMSGGVAGALPSVWISANTPSQIFRTDLDGNNLPAISTGFVTGYVADWAIVG